MIKKQEIAYVSGNIKDVLEKQFKLGYTISSIALRKGDVRVNGEKIKQDKFVKAGDEIVIYYKEKEYEIAKVYEDDNILIINKPKKIEVISKFGESLTTQLQQKYQFIKPCHRLDFNTSGLVIFAKNESSLEAMLLAFKEERVEKNYEALVVGKPKNNAELVAYLKKDSDKSFVYVSDDKERGGDEIRTDYRLISQINPEIAHVSVTLHTGKTHQIRAHLAYVGLPVLGDDKYGIKKINNNYKQKSQCLVSVKVGFKFDKSSCLNYLNNKSFEIVSGLKEKIGEEI